MRENLTVTCEQQKHRPACASVQSDHHLCYSLTNHAYTLQNLIFLRVSVAEPYSVKDPKRQVFTTRPVCVRVMTM